MADEVDWLPVLQKVFKDYGTQLRRSKVKKFAAKVARQQGRTEDKKELQSQFKAFLKSDKGRNSVVEKDDVLSLGSSEAAGPSQPRLSLFDLAEAAASLSKKQPTRMQPKRPSAKPKSQDNPLAVTKGPRSIRKRKTSSSPDEAASLLPASTAGMQTRGRTRRQSLDSPPDGPSSSPVLHSAALPSRSRAAKQQLAADAGQADIPVQGGSDALTHDDMHVEAGKAAPSSKAGTDSDQLDKAPDQQPAASGDMLYASPATTSDSPAQTPSPPEAPFAMLIDTDQEPGPSRHEQTAPDPHAILFKQESNHADQTGTAIGSLQDTAAGLHDQAEVERSDGGPIKSAVKAKKRKHRTEAENRQLPSSATQPPEPDAALPEAAALVPAGEPAVKPKKHKRKLNKDDSSQPAPAAKLPEEESNEPGASRLQQEADKPAAQPLAAKAKKQKHRHSKQSPSDADVQAVESPAGNMVAADAPAEEAAVASQMVQEPIEAVSQDATAEPEQMKDKKKKKKKKKRQIEDVATGSQPDSTENAAVPAAAVVQDQPELFVTEEPSVQPDREEPSDQLKKKKKKKKKRHSDAGVDAQQPAAVSAAAVEPEMESTQAEPAQPAQEPDVKPKKKKKKHKQYASVEPTPAGTTAVDTRAAAAEVEAAPETELQQAGVAASTAAEVKPKKRKHKDSASKSKLPSAADGSQIDAVEAGAPHAEAQEPGQPAVKPKRKRKSKVDATAAAEAAADAPSDAPAAAAAAQTPKAKKATAAMAKESSNSTLPGMNSWRENQARTDVKKGKFTRQEKDTLKQAAHTYAQDNGLPSDDFAWLLNKARTSGNRKDVAGAWQTIAQSLPHRTYKSVYACGSRMLSELNYQGKWSKEEDEQLRQLVGEKGSKWKEIGTSLGRFPEGCRDRWRELKLGGSRQSGRWSEEETTKLRSLVNEYLARKQVCKSHILLCLSKEIEEKTRAGDALTLTMDDLESSPADTDSKPTDGRIILDDIDWDVISAQHGTRAAPQCLTKWYTQLAPSMVSKGEWGSGDDRRLLRALAKTGATHDFQVDWGQLVASRSAMQARRRWRLMLKCVKDATDREFHENLHTLLETFTPDLLVAVAGSEAAHDPEAVDDLS